MADIQHKNIAEADLHEPKGVSTATAGNVYIADGAGSGAWANSGSTVHAAAKVSGNATAITPSGAGTFMEWTPTWTAIDQDGITVTGNSFVIEEQGSCFIIASAAAQGQGTGTNVYAYDFAVNGTVVGQKTRRATSNTSDVGAISIQAYLPDLAVNDVVKLYVTNETDTDDVLITDISLFIFKLG